MNSRLKKDFFGDILTKEETYSLPIGPDGQLREVGRARVTINPFPPKGEGHVCGVYAHFHGYNVHNGRELEDFAEMVTEACDFVRRMNAPVSASD